MKLGQFTLGLIGVMLVVYLLIVGKSVILPFVIAVVFTYFIVMLKNLYQAIPFGKWQMQGYVALFLSVITWVLIVQAFGSLLVSSIDEIIRGLGDYQDKFGRQLVELSRMLDVQLPTSLDQLMGQYDLRGLVGDMAQVVATIASNLGLIIIYVIFMLFEYHTFDRKLQVLVRTKQKYKKVSAKLRDVVADINAYVMMKTFISLLTAVLSYIVLLVLGVDFAIFWALMTFILNFIPNVGSVIAVLMPSVVALVQFEGFSSFLLVFFILGAIQFSIGSILDPRLVGHRLNLSPLLIIIFLAFWGTIWGVVGMFLCVPIMVIINIILAEFPKTRPIAILLSQDPSVLQDQTYQ